MFNMYLQQDDLRRKELALPTERCKLGRRKLSRARGKQAEAEKAGEETAGEEESGDRHKAFNCWDRL